MAIVEDLVFALGLASLVLGQVFLAWRSQRQDRAGSISRRLLEAVHVSVFLGIAIVLLRPPGPNRLFSVGLGILIGSRSLLIVLGNWCASLPMSKRALYTVWPAANLVGGTLLSAGAAAYGGAVGWLGAIVALAWALFHAAALWVVLRGLADDDAAMRSE